MGDKFFRKKAGKTAVGGDYEHMVVADLILKLIENEDVVNFKLASNKKIFGLFDDIVLEIKYADQSATYAFQLKHKSTSIVLDSLRSESGVFSIKTYFESFPGTEVPCSCILFTNSKLNVKTKKKSFIGVNICCKTEISACEPLTLLNTSQNNDCCYKFEIATEDCLNEHHRDYKKFMDNFYVYSDQQNVDTVTKSVLTKFKKKFSDSSEENAKNYIDFIIQWNKREDNKPELDKALIQRIVALIILTPSTELTFGSCGDEIGKRRLLREAISSFDITVLETRDCTTVRSLWEDLKADLENTKEKEEALKKYSVIIYRKTPYISDDVMWTELLWLMGKCPLIITENSATYEAIKLCPDMKYIICGTNSVKNILQNFSVFENLSDLQSRPNLYENIITTFTYSIQGKKEVDLKSLIQLNGRVCSVVTVDALIKMLECSYRLSEEKEKIPSTYIPRSITANLIDNEYFETLQKDTVIVLSLTDKYDSVKSKLTNFNKMSCSTLLCENKSDISHGELYHISSTMMGPELYISEDECSQTDFERVCVRNKGCKSYHQFRMKNEQFLEWIRSNGNISDLNPFRSRNVFIVESSLYGLKPETNVNLLIDEPGMGKTVLLKNIKNHSPLDVWSVFLNPGEVTLLCSRIENLQQCCRTEELIAFVIDTKYKNHSTFDQEIIKVLLQNSHVAYFWDALDELSTKNLKIVIELIKDLSHKSSYQWLTSRCRLKQELEQQFNVLSRSIRRFDEDEQTKYIYDRLSDVYSDQEIQEIIKKIISTITLVKHNDFLGIPLQISVLTKLLRQNKTDEFSLTELYQQIIDKNFERHYKKKAAVEFPNEALTHVLQTHKRSMCEHYKKAAVKTLLAEEMLEQFSIDCDRFLEGIKDRDDNVGIITAVADNSPKFLHNSYAEFFAAAYFVEHHNEIPNLKKIIYDERYVNVRFFYDLLTGKYSSAHMGDLFQQFKDETGACSIKDRSDDPC